MNCEDTKDWFTCYVTVGGIWLITKSLTLVMWIGWLVIIPLLIVFGLPLALLGWILENRK